MFPQAYQATQCSWISSAHWPSLEISQNSRPSAYTHYQCMLWIKKFCLFPHLLCTHSQVTPISHSFSTRSKLLGLIYLDCASLASSLFMSFKYTISLATPWTLNAFQSYHTNSPLPYHKLFVVVNWCTQSMLAKLA